MIWVNFNTWQIAFSTARFINQKIEWCQYPSSINLSIQRSQYSSPIHRHLRHPLLWCQSTIKRIIQQFQYPLPIDVQVETQKKMLSDAQGIAAYIHVHVSILFNIFTHIHLIMCIQCVDKETCQLRILVNTPFDAETGILLTYFTDWYWIFGDLMEYLRINALFSQSAMYTIRFTVYQKGGSEA